MSTRFNASVIQYSEVSGGNNVADNVDSNKGILLMRNDLKIAICCFRSFRDVASAKISNEARIRSSIVDWVSP